MRVLSLALLAAVLAPAASAALWDNSRWALSASATAGAGYDSNLFTRAGGAGDGYLVATPALKLRKINSQTGLEAEVSAKSSGYFYLRELNTTDPSLVIRVRYPADDEELATQELVAHADRSTDANPEVGGRLRRDSYGAKWNGTFKPTGKLVLQPEVEVGQTDYLTPGFNTNESDSAGVILAYLANERLQLGANYDFEYSRSRPDNPLEEQITGRRHLVAFTGRGDFLPKVSGKVLVGVSLNNYSGGYNHEKWDSVAQISLIWAATARGNLTVKVGRNSYFSPNGSALTNSGIGLEWNQELKNGFFATVGIDAADVHYDPIARNDRIYGASFLFRYARTERFSITAGLTFSTQDSNDPAGNFDRTTLATSATYKF